MADRYCGRCGHELSPEDQFCRNCGSPVHEAATVPTSEADVPVPSPPQQDGTLQSGWVKRHLYLTVGLAFVGLIFVGIVVAALAGGGGGGGGKVAADPFANGKFYTFNRRVDKFGGGSDQLSLVILAGSESESQIDKIVRELDYDKAKFELVTANVLTNDEVSEKLIEEIAREHKTGSDVSNEDWKQRGVLVITNSVLAGKLFGIGPGEHVYFESSKEFNQPHTPTPSASAGASISSEANFGPSITNEDKDCQMYKPCKFGSYTSDKTLGSITITNATSQDFIPNETGQGWSGAFVVVYFDYTYGGTVPASTEDPTMALEDSDGRLYSYAYDPTSSYAIDTGADLFPYGEIQPGTTKDAVVIFEVSPDASGFNLYAWDPIQPQPSEVARIALNV